MDIAESKCACEKHIIMFIFDQNSALMDHVVTFYSFYIDQSTALLSKNSEY